MVKTAPLPRILLNLHRIVTNSSIWAHRTLCAPETGHLLSRQFLPLRPANFEPPTQGHAARPQRRCRGSSHPFGWKADARSINRGNASGRVEEGADDAGGGPRSTTDEEAWVGWSSVTPDCIRTGNAAGVGPSHEPLQSSFFGAHSASAMRCLRRQWTQKRCGLLSPRWDVKEKTRQRVNTAT